MNIKVGGLYKVKSWEEMEREYGLDGYGAIHVPFGFPASMRYLCNKIVRIKEIEKTKYHSEIIDLIIVEGEENRWFSKKMFEPLYSLKDMLKDKNLLKGERL